MFNWVCPKCGKDVAPSKTECPYCAERDREAALAGARAEAPVPPPAFTPPPASTPSAPVMPAPAPVMMAPPPPLHPEPPPAWTGHPPQYQPPHAPPPGPWPHQHPPRSGPPTWLMIAAFALIFLGIGAAIFWGLHKFSRSNPAEKAGVENPGDASRQKVSNPLQKYVEVVGIRLVAEHKKPTARFVVVNHSNAEIVDLTANVTLWASTSRSEEDSVGSFSFQLPALRPNGYEELSAPLKTKMKPYELPDWQNLAAEIQITSPQ